MTVFGQPFRLFIAAVWIAAPLSGYGQEPPEFTETEIPCGIRCALGAIALTSENGRVPQIDPASLQALPSQGMSLLDVKRFLGEHKMAGKAFSDVSLATLHPSPEQPVILQLSVEWLDRTFEAFPNIEHDALPHFVLAVERDGDTFFVWDVSVGHEYVALADLEPYFTGHAMTVYRRSPFLGGYFERNPAVAYLLVGSIAALCAAVVLYRRRPRLPAPNTRT